MALLHFKLILTQERGNIPTTAMLKSYRPFQHPDILNSIVLVSAWNNQFCIKTRANLMQNTGPSLMNFTQCSEPFTDTMIFTSYAILELKRL